MRKMLLVCVTLMFLTLIACDSPKQHKNEETNVKNENESNVSYETTSQNEIKKTNRVFLEEEEVIIKYDIDNDGKTEDVVLTEVSDTDISDLNYVILTIKKDGKEVFKKEINGTGKSGIDYMDVCSLYIVELNGKNYILSFYNLGYGSVYEVYNLYSVESNGDLKLVESKEFGFGYTEYGTFGYSEKDIEGINEFYTTLSEYLKNAKLIFDVDGAYYSYFIYSSSEGDMKTYEDAKNKIVGFYGEAPYDISELNDAMKDYGYEEYIINDSDTFKDKLVKSHKALWIFQNDGKLDGE